MLGAVKEWPGNDVTWRTTRATAILDRPLRAAATRDAWVGTKGWAPLEVEQKDEKDKKERKKDAVVQNWCLTSRAHTRKALTSVPGLS